ncbi:hypothetical protein [Streptomyces sp. V3I7]|uniref:hypothetical protein n=1 Tax=Streptomyces sp. V3I7 TaxID=3042278 RepID=UPI0027844F15|nr:hypothetical protein [Streptomyces sp. V3I7]MDQ0994818.1 hypothetical protein [Streptomyces sp. V3I7]
MPSTPAASDGYCTNRAPVPGSVRTVNAYAAGPKFMRLHGRSLAQCTCGRKHLHLTGRGTLPRHKPPQA